MDTVRNTVRKKPPGLSERRQGELRRNGRQRNTLGGTARTVLRHLADDEGAATAEYAVATMAAVGFAGLLIVILRGDEVKGILTDLVRNALTVG